MFGLRTPERQQIGGALGWNDIKDLMEGIVTYILMDDTQPGARRGGRSSSVPLQ